MIINEKLKLRNRSLESGVREPDASPDQAVRPERSDHKSNILRVRTALRAGPSEW